MTWRIGQEIECIRDDWWDENQPLPKCGEVFHFAGDAGKFKEYDLIRLREFPKTRFAAVCFKPIIKTDISSLEEIARKITQGERVDA